MLALLAWHLLLVLSATLRPFGGGAGAGALTLTPPASVEEIAGNLLLFMPVGLGITVLVRDRSRGGAVLFAGLVIVLLSAGVEIAQWFVQNRDVSPYDVGLNGAGGAAASAFAHVLFRRVSGARVLMAISAGLWCALAAGALLAAETEGNAMHIAGWNAAFPVLLGDEVGGERPYVGRVDRGEICAPAAGSDGAARKEECVGAEADLEDRARLVAAALRSQEVRAEARVLSLSGRQTGPARIITFSHGPYLRNFTLAQRADHVVLRIRTPFAGENGLRSQYLLTGAIPVGVPSVVRAAYRGGSVTLSVKSTAGEIRSDYSPGLLLSWTRQRPVPGLSRGDVDLRFISRTAVVTAVVLFAPVALLVTTMFGFHPAASLTVAPVVTAGALALSDAAFTGQVEIAHLGLAGLAAAAGVALLLTLEQLVPTRPPCEESGETKERPAGQPQ